MSFDRRKGARGMAIAPQRPAATPFRVRIDALVVALVLGALFALSPVPAVIARNSGLPAAVVVGLIATIAYTLIALLPKGRSSDSGSADGGWFESRDGDGCGGDGGGDGGGGD